MTIKIYNSIDEIPQVQELPIEKKHEIQKDVLVSKVTRSYLYMRMATIILLLLYVVGTSCLPNSVVDWLEEMGYVHKVEATVIGQDRFLLKFKIAEVVYMTNDGVEHVDSFWDFKKHVSMYYNNLDKPFIVEGYYYDVMPNTLYPYDLDWMFYVFLFIVFGVFIGVTYTAEVKGMSATLMPQTSFKDIKAIYPIKLIGVVGSVYPEPTLKNISYMHHQTVWQNIDTNKIYVGKPYIVGNGISALRLSEQTSVSYKWLNFLGRQNTGILIRHKDRYEIVFPDSTKVANIRIFEERKLLKLIHQGRKDLHN